VIVKTSKKRIDTAVARHVDRYQAAEESGQAGQMLAAGLDWLRAEAKLMERCLGDAGAGERYLAEAAECIHRLAVKAGAEILEGLE
jgi:hypothetical protein